MSGLSRLRNMFRVPDLRNKIFFTIFIIFIFRVGSYVPVPYVDFHAIMELKKNAATGVLGFLDLFSGGALTGAAVFALGIMPYITSSIIMQLLGVVIPKLEEWQNEGQTGQKKITQWTRYLTVALALMQSTALVFVLKSGKGGLLGQSFAQLPQGTRADQELHRVQSRADHPHVDGGYRARHVARRADHPARHRQRHVDPDLHVGRVPPAVPVRRDLDRSRPPAVHRDPHHRPVHDPRRSSRSSRASAEYQSSSRNVSSAAACTAARAPTSR